MKCEMAAWSGESQTLHVALLYVHGSYRALIFGNSPILTLGSLCVPENYMELLGM